MDIDIVGELFEIFNDEYGVSVADPQSLFDGQRDLLEFVMGLGRRLEQRYFQALGNGYVGTKVVVDGVECCFKGNRPKTIHGCLARPRLLVPITLVREARPTTRWMRVSRCKATVLGCSISWLCSRGRMCIRRVWSTSSRSSVPRERIDSR